MLFFREIMDEKLKDRAFREFYNKECHICSTTVKVIADLEEKGQRLPDILETLHISKADYEGLKDGEDCNPVMVKQLCAFLGFDEPGLFKNCPKLKGFIF